MLNHIFILNPFHVRAVVPVISSSWCLWDCDLLTESDREGKEAVCQGDLGTRRSKSQRINFLVGVVIKVMLKSRQP